jgi:galactonate dehydratase
MVAVLVTSVETFQVAPRWLFVKVSTDEGVTGWGEASLEGSSDVVRVAVAALAEYLVGRDPASIERHWQVLAKGGFYRGGPVLSSALAGLDQALWDIAGKIHGVPVHQLLGGPVRDRVRVYGWVGGDDPSGVAEAVQRQVDNGLTAIKMNASGALGHLPTPAQSEGVVERAAAARSALGPERDMAIDFHGRISAPAARRLLPLLEPLHPLFVEEPVLPGNNHPALERIITASSTPIATGERLYSRWEFLPVLESGVAVVQPDVSHAGGISEVRRIAALAETFDAALAPHCPLGPLALAACLQVDFATPNFLIQEQSLGIHYNVHSDLLDYLLDTSVFRFDDGFIARPLGPGLGVEIDEQAVRRADALSTPWRTPTWTLPDGSYAEW